MTSEQRRLRRPQDSVASDSIRSDHQVQHISFRPRAPSSSVRLPLSFAATKGTLRKHRKDSQSETVFLAQ